MKIFTCLLACFLLSGVKLYCQQYDSLDMDKISINQLPLDIPKSEIIKKLGKPSKITFQSGGGSEVAPRFQYHYKKSIIEVSPKGYLVGFDILDTSFVLSYKSTTIKIGDSVSTLRKPFPRSYKMYQIYNKKEGYEYFRLPYKGGDIDYIIIGIKNNKIYTFRTWEDLT
jgi:hypothetical protein